MKRLQSRGLSPHNAKASADRHRQHLSHLADALCHELATGHVTTRHHQLTHEVIDLLIDRYPDCPRWASRAVDQLLHADEQLQEGLR